MKKFLYLLSCFMFFSLFVQAQNTHNHGKNHERCSSHLIEQANANNPVVIKKRAEIERFTQQWIADNQHTKNNSVLTIPVVIHVVWNDPVENISDAQIFSQLYTLNEDFRKQNADTTFIPSVFAGLAADTEIEFCLASVDPNGNQTTGINRVQTNIDQIGNFDSTLWQTTAPLWDTASYLNIYVCEITNSGGILGYATTPGNAFAGGDGVVMDYRYFGNIGTVTPPFDLGRTLTHEVGHYLNLAHIWGNAGGCTDDDGVADTPDQDGANYGCNTHPLVSCNSDDMFMNYMDYGDDPCLVMFSQGQKMRMLAALNGPRAGLLTSNGCGMASNYDLAALDATHSFCENPITSTITVGNLGTNTVTSFDVAYRYDALPWQTLTVTDTLATYQSSSIALPINNNLSFGMHTLEYYVDLPTDSVSFNDSSLVNFEIINGGPLTIDLITDIAPAETSYRVEDLNGNIVFQSTPFTQIFESVTETLCLPYGCYNIILDDAGGDGFAFSSSYFTVSNEVFVVGQIAGNFGSSDTLYACISDQLLIGLIIPTTVCVDEPITPVNRSLNDVSWNWSLPNSDISTSTDPTPTFSYPTSGTYPATFTIMDASGNSVDTTIMITVTDGDLLTINVMTDDYGHETSYEVKDSTGTVLLFNDGLGDQTFYQDFLCLPAGCYTFTIFDSFGDGLAAPGFYQLINAEGDTILVGDGDFGGMDSVSFCIDSVATSTEMISTPTIVKVFPNPTSNILNFDAPTMPTAIEVIDVMGRKVQAINEPTSTRIDLSRAAAGVYFVRFRFEDNIVTKRVVRR